MPETEARRRDADLATKRAGFRGYDNMHELSFLSPSFARVRLRAICVIPSLLMQFEEAEEEVKP
jgi:hypothetical protein